MSDEKSGSYFKIRMNSFFSASVYEEISFGILNMGADEETAEKAVRQIIEELGLSAFQEEPTHAFKRRTEKNRLRLQTFWLCILK